MDRRGNPVYRVVDVADICRPAAVCKTFEMGRAVAGKLGIPARVCPAFRLLPYRTRMDSRRSLATCRRHRVELHYFEQLSAP